MSASKIKMYLSKNLVYYLSTKAFKKQARKTPPRIWGNKKPAFWKLFL